MKPLPFKPGQLVTWSPNALGIFLVLKSDTNTNMWLLTLQKAVRSDTIGEVRSDYIEDYLPIEQVQ